MESTSEATKLLQQHQECSYSSMYTKIEVGCKEEQFTNTDTIMLDSKNNTDQIEDVIIIDDKFEQPLQNEKVLHEKKEMKSTNSTTTESLRRSQNNDTKNAQGGSITFNGTSVSKIDIDKTKNDKEYEEDVECSKCKKWQHQICALYDDKRNMNCSGKYTCPTCYVKGNINDVHMPLPMFEAKDLPRTRLSDHIEGRIFNRLKKIGLKGEKNKNPDDDMEVRIFN
ncbi:unnamed protein product [Sphenostylis stenocarpa]|uniref:histone acetyltransferase n=1 Tax=Sphenostylis stenocarpa TaxID=92480 RepID=A0AA86VY22_9FABA|nr:unnamed protein product [Sphenostylis stenocarpa]